MSQSKIKKAITSKQQYLRVCDRFQDFDTRQQAERRSSPGSRLVGSVEWDGYSWYRGKYRYKPKT